MGISVRILADSIAPCGARLTTREWTYPRGIHAEIMTHKMFSKNSASSRAIPTEKLIQRVVEDPFVPKYIGANKSGMQAGEELSDDDKGIARWNWLDLRDHAVRRAKEMLKVNVHKQVVNRAIEPWMWITVIASATENDNLWGLRCHEMAEPHFQELAYMDRDAVASSIPKVLKAGEWHLPLIFPEDRNQLWGMVERPGVAHEVLEAEHDRLMVKVSTGRCARVSYLTHDGKREIEKDVELHDRLVVQTPLHASPAEHVAQAMDYPAWWKDVVRDHEVATPAPRQLQQYVLAARDRRGDAEPTPAEMRDETVLSQMRSGNFLGFRQYRKMLRNEHIGGRMP